MLPMAFGSFHLRKVGLCSRSSFMQQRNLIRSVSITNDNEINSKGSQPGDDEQPKRRKKKKKNNSKDKRREFIGKAKAVDRGQWAVVYNPGGDDRLSFTAKSGLPDRTKPFTVLGIESSCDDTGGAFISL